MWSVSSAGVFGAVSFCSLRHLTFASFFRKTVAHETSVGNDQFRCFLWTLIQNQSVPRSSTGKTVQIKPELFHERCLTFRNKTYWAALEIPLSPKQVIRVCILFFCMVKSWKLRNWNCGSSPRLLATKLECSMQRPEPMLMKFRNSKCLLFSIKNPKV